VELWTSRGIIGLAGEGNQDFLRRKPDGTGIDSWCIKVEFQICSVKQSLVGLHKEKMSLPTLLTQRSTPMTGQGFFSSVTDGVFNLLSSFTEIKEFGRLHCVIDSNKQS